MAVFGIVERKKVAEQLIHGYYLRSWRTPTGADVYRLYNSIHTPVGNVSKALIKSLEKFSEPASIKKSKKKIELFQKDKKGRITLRLSAVRMLHGKHLLKQLYKTKKRNEKIHC